MGLSGNITVTWSIKGQTFGFAKFEFSSNVNKASLNPAIVNFQRFLKVNFQFTMLFMYIIFVQDGKKGSLRRLRM